MEPTPEIPVKPMPNTPVVAASAALAAIGITAETLEEQEKLNDQVKEAFFAHIESLLGFELDRETGEFTSRGVVDMDDAQKERWAQLCTEFSRGERDPQRAEALLRAMGNLLREAVKESP
jgi:hypothetical protein